MSKRHVRQDVESKGLDHTKPYASLSKGTLFIAGKRAGFVELEHVEPSNEQPVEPVVTLPVVDVNEYVAGKSEWSNVSDQKVDPKKKSKKAKDDSKNDDPQAE